MAENEDDLSVTLPEELRRQFDEVQRRLWRVETSVALCWIATSLVASFLLLFISDRIWNTPPGLRLIFLLVAVAVVIVTVWNWARRWLWHRRTLLDLANIVQRRHRRLGDRLLGIVELAQEQRHQPNFSPALYHAAIHQVAEEARHYDFRRSVSAVPAKKLALVTGVIVACWLVISVALPSASWNAFLRWLAPTAGIPRYTLITLDGLPREMIVAHGEPFTISGNVHYRSLWRPDRVIGRLANIPKIEAPVNSGRIQLQIPGQTETGVLRIQVGDATARVTINPVYRPSLRELSAQIELPGYLQYPDEQEILQNGSVQAVEGSRIAFHGAVSRALSSAMMQTDGSGTAALKIDGNNFTTSPTQPDGMAEYTFNWRDELGLSNAVPLILSVATQKDAPPTAELPGLPREAAVLDSDVLRIRTDASDDFGVRDVGLTWDIVSGTPLAESIVSEVKIMAPTAHERKISKVFFWSPREFRIPDDATVELQGYARDYYPDRERSRTEVYHIQVLSPEEHAELMRQQLEDVMSRIEDVTRLQEKITADLHAVKDNDKLPESEKSARIGESKNEQQENAAQLEQLSNQAENALHEAMKNPLFPIGSIHQWSQSAQQWQELAMNKMKNAASSMQSAQQSSSDRPQQLAEAAQKADDILRALEKMQDKANQHMDQLQALTLSQRLRKVGKQEQEISAQLLKSASDTIGLPPGDLPEKLRQFEHSLSGDQGRALKETDQLQGEISRFFERTHLTNYGTVSREMMDSHTTDALDHLNGLIGDNIGIEASGGLEDWSGRLQKWGDKLEPKSDSSGGGGQGSGGKSQKKDLTEQLIALLRLREGEMTLRDQTSVLDQQKGAPDAYRDQANSLVDAQEKLAGSLEQIHQQIGLPQLDSSFAEPASRMKSVAAILQVPQTGPPADQAEGNTIDSLSDLINLINEQAQHASPQSSSSSSNSAEEMAFLMRMMQSKGDAKGMALQPATGLNRAGGTTDRAGNPISGNTSGKNGPGRNVDKASGIINNTPAEFRDALDNYFHGIEHSKD